MGLVVVVAGSMYQKRFVQQMRLCASCLSLSQKYGLLYCMDASNNTMIEVSVVCMCLKLGANTKDVDCKSAQNRAL